MTLTATLTPPAAIVTPAGGTTSPTDPTPTTPGQRQGILDTTDAPRPGSRADRMRQPRARKALQDVAEHYGVCVRPLALRRTDKVTGLTEIVDIPCGARLSSKCKPCAEKNRKLRQRQIREGWHLTDDPEPPVETPTEEVRALLELRCALVFERHEAERISDWKQVADLDAGIVDLDEELSTHRVRGKLPRPAEESKPRKARSTRRREDAPELPRLPVSTRTTGKVYTGKDGRTYQPSTLLTITLGSYGPVHTGARTRRGHTIPCSCGILHADWDGLLGTPIDPDSYDYRRAAADAVFFAAGLDRLWQNLRRAAGFAVQYAGAVELQRRLTPHAHFAMRGTIPRALLKQVAAATYHQVWWPQFDTAVYSLRKPPVWDGDTSRFVDPVTRQPLTSWTDAVDALDGEGAEPAYVLRLGTVDARGIQHGTKDAEKAIRYVTKYVTKDLTEQAAPSSEPQRDHFDRLHAELALIPCSPKCANWLLYGVEPEDPKAGLVPGRCSGKVHQRKTLGFTGRRVLISRRWSGKTLADLRADNRAWVREVLAGALADDEQPDTAAGRYLFEIARPTDRDVGSLENRIMRSIYLRHTWKDQLEQALRPPEPVPATEINTTTSGEEK
nr:replication initiator [Hamadaea tsunoensis]